MSCSPLGAGWRYSAWRALDPAAAAAAGHVVNPCAPRHYVLLGCFDTLDEALAAHAEAQP